MNEAEKCRTLVGPNLEAAGWLANGDTLSREQIGITPGRIVLPGGTPKRLKKKIPGFLLDLPPRHPPRCRRGQAQHPPDQ
jgi:hypothetical protein